MLQGSIRNGYKTRIKESTASACAWRSSSAACKLLRSGGEVGGRQADIYCCGCLGEFGCQGESYCLEQPRKRVQVCQVHCRILDPATQHRQFRIMLRNCDEGFPTIVSIGERKNICRKVFFLLRKNCSPTSHYEDLNAERHSEELVETMYYTSNS